jgi:hypothetical protein
MDDSKLAFGLGGQSGTSSISMSITNIKSDIVGLSTTITNTLQPAVDKLVRSLNSVHMPKLVDKNGNLLSSGFNGDSTNRIASLPPKAITSGNGYGSGNGGGDNGNNNVASNGSSSNFFSRNIGSFSKGMAATQGISDAVSNLLPSTQTSVMQDYLTNRSAFYGQGGYGGNLKQQTGAVRSLQQSLARNGTALNPMDTTNALAAAQATGLSGFSNFGQIMQGAASASNFTPGIGIQGATQAIGSTLNAPTTVNMLRTIGINLRGPNGSMMTVDQVVDQIWAYLSRSSGGKGMDKKSIQFSLAPGNGIYGMLNNLFNGDPTMIQMVSNMLLAKAQFGGQQLDTISKSQMIKAGLQTQTVADIASQTSAQTDLLTNTASAASGGYDAATKMNTAATRFENAVKIFAGISSVNSLVQGISGGTLGTIGKVIGKVLPFLAFAEGGPVKEGGPMGQGDLPYVVGEKGPELFIPKSDGTIIPNHLLGKFTGRAAGGDVSAYESNFFKDIGAPNTSSNRSTLEQWMHYESGGYGSWNNPINTTLSTPGATSVNSAGVKKYATPAQGAMAAADTLLNTKGEGYESILSSMRAGNSSANNWSSIVKSGWVTGKVDPKRTSYAAGGGTSGNSASSTSSAASSGAWAAAIAAGQAGFNGGNGGDINYGGFTLNINGITDPNKVASAVKAILQNPAATIGKK